MGIESLLIFLLYVVVIFVVAWVCFYLIREFVPEPLKTPGLVIAGAVVLIVVIYLLIGNLPRGNVKLP